MRMEMEGEGKKTGVQEMEGKEMGGLGVGL